jgi:predicted dehydrogenase
MSAGPKLRVGVIGRGFGARVVAPVFEDTAGFEVVDVVTPRDDDAVSALCARRDVDLISVHSPPFMHLDHVRRAIEGGHAVLCDKPFGLNASEAQAMHDLARAAGVVNLVNFEFRRHPARRELRALMRGGAIGRVEQLRWVTCVSVWGPSRPFGWSFDAALGGGWIRLSGSHTIDYVRWSLGEVVEAVALTRMTIGERADDHGSVRCCTAEDGYTGLLRTAAGACATIEATSTSPVERPNRITAIGSRGVLELTNENARETDARIVLHTPSGASEVFSFCQEDTYHDQMRQWAGIVRDAVRSGVPDAEAPTFADGLACSRVMDCLLGRTGPEGSNQQKEQE